jgi:predicted AlkP superfamily pyrophosphatase or phosphodiesterase
MRIRLRQLLVWFGIVLLLAPATRAAAAVVPPRERVVILVSLDGFRWDYLQKYQPTNLTKLAAEGVQAKRLIPAFPSLTFPNHYTIVTGLWPEHHGIIGNNFYDPKFKAHYNAFNAGSSESRWWGGEPIWVTAIKQGRTAKCMFWPGSQAEIGGMRPTEWRPFSKNTTFAECVDTVLGWLDNTNKRPSFVTLYFHEPDSAGHKDGLDAPQLAEAVTQVDNAVGRLVEGIHRLRLGDVVNLVIVSDHGMVELSSDRVITLGDYTDMTKVQVDFSGPATGLRPRDGNVDGLYAALKAKEKHFRLYRREQMPERYHFRNNDRIPPLVLIADEGWFITPRSAVEQAERTLLKATHGFDPELESMGGVFIAQGAAFRRGVTIGPVENVHVYNLLCATLGLKPAANDGDNRLATEVLTP